MVHSVRSKASRRPRTARTPHPAWLSYVGSGMGPACGFSGRLEGPLGPSVLCSGRDSAFRVRVAAFQNALNVAESLGPLASVDDGNLGILAPPDAEGPVGLFRSREPLLEFVFHADSIPSGAGLSSPTPDFV